MYKPKNYKSNCQVEIPEGLLNGQSMGNLGPMKFGSSTIDDAGCGPLAVYNAMQYMRKPVSLPKVIREMEIYAAPLGARFGSSATLMMIFFWRHHVKFRPVWRIKKIDQTRAGVLLFWTKRPIFSGSHFVFYCKGEDGRMRVYNRYSNSTDVHTYNSIRDMISQKLMFIGFAFKDSNFGEEKEK